MKGCEFPEICHIDTCPMFYKEFSNFIMSIGTSIVQGYQTTGKKNTSN
jgi:hypothetical protein